MLVVAAAMVWIALYDARRDEARSTFAEAPWLPRCWSDPIAGQTPLACGEFAAMVVPEAGDAT